MKKISVVLATRNEEENIGRCLASVQGIAKEIVIFDEGSTDNTVKIAKSYGARVYNTPHEENFHITKQKAIDKATNEWILQLDADEVVTGRLASEIREIVEMSEDEVAKRELKDKNKKRLFKKHTEIIKARDGLNFETGEVVAFLIPRLNMFLGKPLIHAGVYPDPAIRLIKKGKARLPGKSVHEIMEVDGRVGWLESDMEHYDSPTLRRYFSRLNRYTDIHAYELKRKHAPKNIFYALYYCLFKFKWVFINMYIRNKGFLDGARGFLWCFFSASHYPIAYFKYYTS